MFHVENIPVEKGVKTRVEVWVVAEIMLAMVSARLYIVTYRL